MVYMKAFNKELSLNIIKDNISLIILIPTLLGGFWQLLELTNIGAGYVRFFSVSQLVADGLLILFVLGCVSVPLWYFFGEANLSFQLKIMSNSEPTEDAQKELVLFGAERKWVSKKNAYTYLLVLTIIYVIIIYWILWPEVVNPFLQHRKGTVLGLSGLFFTIGFTLIYVKILIETMFEAHSWKINLKRRSASDLYFSLIIMGVGFSILFSLYLIKIFHESFLLPENFRNNKYVDCKVRSRYHDKPIYHIAYFNDKYIFLKMTDASKIETIEVFKFEDFLDGSACK